jgi:hypothetical protein
MKRAIPLVACVALLVACGGSSTSDTTSPATGTADTVVTDTSGTPAGKLAAVTVDVTVGVDSSATRRVDVALGAPVTLNITNPGADDEFHLHGYDLSPGMTPKGETASISFTADKAGEFEVESHVTEEVLVVLVVS